MIIYDDMIADMLSNRKLNPTVIKLFITRSKKLNIPLAFITQSFNVPKDIILNSTHYFIMNIPNKV